MGLTGRSHAVVVTMGGDLVEIWVELFGGNASGMKEKVKE